MEKTQSTPAQPVDLPRLVRLRRHWKFVARTSTGTFKCTLMAGETGEYFAHTRYYLFAARRGWVPYISAAKLASNPAAWECQPNEKLRHSAPAENSDNTKNA